MHDCRVSIIRIFDVDVAQSSEHVKWSPCCMADGRLLVVLEIVRCMYYADEDKRR